MKQEVKACMDVSAKGDFRAAHTGHILCALCPRHCALGKGETGACAARWNPDGRIVSKNYGQVTSLALDPIEKKPLRHFHPGRLILSVGSFGCNLFCPFCQNAELSRAKAGDVPARYISPEALTALAAQLAAEHGNLGVAFTYNEPLVGIEYVMDTARLLKEKHLDVVLVTNGQIAPEPLEPLLPLVDAWNIDLKGFTQAYYDWLGGSLETVKHTVERAVASGSEVEVTTLVVPGKNDSVEDMEREAAWLASLSVDLPLHITRYFPRYRCEIPETPRETIERLAAVAQSYLHHVYRGNLSSA